MNLDLALKVVNNDLEDFTKELKVEETPQTLLSIISKNKYIKIASKVTLSLIAAGIMNTAFANEVNTTPTSQKSLQDAFQQVHKSDSPLFIRASNPISGTGDIYIYHVGSNNNKLDSKSRGNLSHFLANSRFEGKPSNLSTLKEINIKNAQESGHTTETSRAITQDQLVVLGSETIRFSSTKHKPLSEEFAFYHETAHIGNYEGDTLLSEVSSDIFATLALAKSQKMDINEVTGLIDELANIRISRVNDIEHQSTGGLKVLGSFIKNGLNYNEMSLQEMSELSLNISRGLDQYDFAQLRETLSNKSTPTEAEYFNTISTLRELIKKDEPLTADNIKSQPNGESILKFDYATLTSLSKIAKTEIESPTAEFMDKYSDKIKARFNLYSSPKITYRDLILDANFNNNTAQVFADDVFKNVAQDIEKRIKARQEARDIISLLASIGEEALNTPEDDLNPNKNRRPKI